MELSAQAASTPAPASLNPLAAWHLLSLDAPTVAALWTWFVARATGTDLPSTTLAAMFLAVWIVYATDRLLDARALDLNPHQPGIEARHRFHHRHRVSFGATIAAASLFLLALLPTFSPREFKLFVLLAALLSAWFLILHTRPGKHLPKELAVGIFFAAAVFIPPYTPSKFSTLVLPAVLFVALCTLNCLFISNWEAPTRSPLPLSVALISAALAGIRLLPPNRPILSAIAASASLFAILHVFRHRFNRITLRALADLVLLTPLASAFWIK